MHGRLYLQLRLNSRFHVLVLLDAGLIWRMMVSDSCSGLDFRKLWIAAVCKPPLQTTISFDQRYGTILAGRMAQTATSAMLCGPSPAFCMTWQELCFECSLLSCARARFTSP